MICNYLLVYEYVISADVATDTWGGFRRIAATKGLANPHTPKPPSQRRVASGSASNLSHSSIDGSSRSVTPRSVRHHTSSLPQANKPQAGANRTLLLGGRKDGKICVFHMDTGAVEFEIEVSKILKAA